MTSPHTATAEDLGLLRQSVREALGGLGGGPAEVAGPDTWRTRWDILAKQGLWSTIEPPEGSLSAAAVVVEELGRALFAGPAPEALAGTYVMHHLDEDSRPNDVAGSCPASVVIGGDISIALAPSPTGGGRLDPTVAVGPHTVLIVVTAEQQIALVIAGATEAQESPSLDISRRIVTPLLHVTRMTMPRVSDPELGNYGLAARTLLYCADTLGCVDYILERAVEYARHRTTFGVPIGKNQAVAHRLVDHTITAQQMRILLTAAIAAFDAHDGDLDRHVATATTFFAGRAAALISDCVQLAGAIGFTWEFGYHFYLRRVVDNGALGGGHLRSHQRLAEVCPW